MSPEQFAYWLQGFAELTGKRPTEEQWQSIKEHLQTVFVKVTPPLQTPFVPPRIGDSPATLKPPGLNITC